MNVIRKRPIYPLVALAALATLVATGCGGSDDAPVAAAPPAPPPAVILVPGSAVPVSAAITGAGAFTFVSSVVTAGPKDSAEPLEVEPATLGVADNEEPDASV